MQHLCSLITLNNAYKFSKQLRATVRLLSQQSFFKAAIAKRAISVAALKYSEKIVTHQVVSFPAMETVILPIDANKIGRVTSTPESVSLLDDWQIELDLNTPDAKHIQQAAEELRNSDIPVAFPTETVYGLGADATRSSAVKGIYNAKQRPADNPLIVHIASLNQLRALLYSSSTSKGPGETESRDENDSIPPIYNLLIQRFWPGPLTIILPNPPNSLLAPEVTAGLSTFGARMPKSLLALALIKLADRPIAAPSANASTRPSPTEAEHVLDDLKGRIRTILNGGPCDVGVESTVVDGLSNPPAILRPGGISLEQLQQCPGWEHVVVGYKDLSEKDSKPRAPGMKYRHYSPRAPVFLYEAGSHPPESETFTSYLLRGESIGVVRTKFWPASYNIIHDLDNDVEHAVGAPEEKDVAFTNGVEQRLESQASNAPQFLDLLSSTRRHKVPSAEIIRAGLDKSEKFSAVWEINLGSATSDIARGLFAALRDLDKREVSVIFVEGIQDSDGDVAAAVMNRLRKAAEVKVKG